MIAIKDVEKIAMEVGDINVGKIVLQKKSKTSMIVPNRQFVKKITKYFKMKIIDNYFRDILKIIFHKEIAIFGY